METELKEIETKDSAVKAYSYKGYKIEIFQDEDPENPIKNWDMLGKFICWHRNYDLGNCTDFDTPEDVKSYAKKNKALIYPLYMYDHSGIGLSLSNDRYPFNCPWDSGRLGYILVERKDALALIPGATKMSAKVKARVYKVISGEVETYNAYLSGDVYGYVVTKKEEETDISSVWGYYSLDEALEAAKEEIG